MDRKYEILHQYFGYTSFRSGQEALIDALLEGRDVFGVMPTGGGKSLCYQLPALMLEGITLVVSPLISLMKDQVMALKNAGVPAAYLNSLLSPEQMRQIFRNLLDGRYKLVYVAPERLLTEGFLSVIRNLKVSMLAVDEAHCISQWGQDFRPSYLRIVDFLQQLGYRPIVSAFTATATRQVREDVGRILGLQAPLCVVTGFDRPNLYFEVLKPENKSRTLLELIVRRKNKSGIIYCATRKDVERVCNLLQDNGISATRYHAGLPEEERKSNQDDFIYDRCPVMVATNAFGMGIDKSNVAYVIHYNMPQSVEAYYQEAGRAGREGASADCILLYSAGDIQTAKFLIQHPSENDVLSDAQKEQVMAQELARLEKIIGYCKTNDCFRGYILDYFGQVHPDSCGNCGNCTAIWEEQDMTLQAKMILSCVYRIQSYLGYSLGIALITQVLRGSKEKRIRDLGLDALPTYGLMGNNASALVREWIEALEQQGYLYVNPVHSGVSLTGKARNVLFCGETVTMRTRMQPVSPEKMAKNVPAPSGNAELFTILKALRLRIATEEKVPAYIVFSNATLQDMAAKAPETMDAFLAVSGVGTYKAERYGEAFLAEIRQYHHKTSD